MARGKIVSQEEKETLLQKLDHINYQGGQIPSEVVDELNQDFKGNRTPQSCYKLFMKLKSQTKQKEPRTILNSLSSDLEQKTTQTKPTIQTKQTMTNQPTIKQPTLLKRISEYDQRIEEQQKNLQEIQKKLQTYKQEKTNILYQNLIETNKLLNLGWKANKYANATFQEILQNPEAQKLMGEIENQRQTTYPELNLILLKGQNHYELILPLTNNNISVQGVVKTFDLKEPKQKLLRKNLEQIHPSIGFYMAINDSVQEAFETTKTTKQNWQNLVYIDIQNGKPKTPEKIQKLEETLQSLTEEYKPTILNVAPIKLILDNKNNYLM